MALDDNARKRTDSSYSKLSNLRFRRRFASAASIFSILVGLLTITAKLFFLPNTNIDEKKIVLNSNEINQKFDSLAKADILMRNAIKEYKIELNNLGSAKQNDRALEIKFSLWDSRIKRDSAQLYDLRASINPEKPEEILKLARLNDKIEQLKIENNTLKENLKSEQTQFEQSINNQLSNSRTFYIALITILLPITIKFIMQQFKDYNKE